MTSSRSSVSEMVSVKTALRSSERSSAKSRVRLPPVASKRLALRLVVISRRRRVEPVAGGERLLLQRLHPGEIRASVHAHRLRPPAGASSARRSPTARGRWRRRSARPASATESSASVSTPVSSVSCSISDDCRASGRRGSRRCARSRPARKEAISEAISRAARVWRSARRSRSGRARAAMASDERLQAGAVALGAGRRGGSPSRSRQTAPPAPGSTAALISIRPGEPGRARRCRRRRTGPRPSASSQVAGIRSRNRSIRSLA